MPQLLMKNGAMTCVPDKGDPSWHREATVVYLSSIVPNMAFSSEVFSMV